MSLLNWRKASRARRVRRERVATSALLRPSEFDHAAACERMRVDRNQSPLSILLITLPKEASRPKDVQQLAKLLSSRLRITDTAGRLRDGRVGVLLPDTTASGAWKVASDICDHYEVGEKRPSCEVMIYPDEARDDHRSDSQPHDEQSNDDGPPQGGRPGSPGSAPSPTIFASSPTTESFFARSFPAWKRALDIFGASVGLVLTAPVIGVAAAAVSLSSKGGPFYSQVREGHGGRRFKIYKIRTMRQGSHALKERLRAQSEQDGPAFKMTADPRVTRIGAFLRKTSIDELPQLLNVLRGEMSLVGPRPLQIEESLACEPWQRQRLMVKPGLTCIWQVKGRSVVAFDDWVRMDLEYARQMNLRNDLKLLAQTPPALLTSKGPR